MIATRTARATGSSPIQPNRMESKMPDLALPLLYRAEVIEPLAAALRGGESCSLVGVGSSGKSNILRHLARPDVREHYFGDASAQTLLIYFDCHKLDAYTSQAVYATIVEVLEKSLTASEHPELRAKLNELWQQIAATENQTVTRRSVEYALDAVFAAFARRVILMLDDCDALIAQAPDQLLRGLRAVRDDYKTALVFLAATRRELPYLRPPTPEFEHFYELLSAHVFFIRPHGAPDAAFIVRRLAARQESNPRPLDDGEIERLLEISGNHAGLLRTIFFASRQGELALHPNAITLFINQDSVWEECQKIWDSLDAEEQADLKALATSETPNGMGLRRLKFKGVIIERQDGTYAIFSPLFLAFVSAFAQSGRDQIGPVVILKPDPMAVTIDGKTSDLNPLEFALFRLLYERRPQTCSRTELINVLLSAEAGEHSHPGPPERRLKKIIDQIRTKIEIPGRIYVISDAEGEYHLIGQDGK
jgi:hypothetical protein